jgi:hypothetical protein
MVKPLLDEAEITVSSPFLVILDHVYQTMYVEWILRLACGFEITFPPEGPISIRVLCAG